MSILTTILLFLAAILVLILLIALLAKKSYSIQRDILIDAPLGKVFNYIRYLKNWDQFNRDAMSEPDKNKEFKGTDGTPGFIYAWSGSSKVGAGEKEIIRIEEGSKIETEIRFIKPFKVTGHSIMTTTTISDKQTKLVFSNSSRLPYPLNFMLLFVEKNIAKGMDESLINLKAILEKES